MRLPKNILLVAVLATSMLGASPAFAASWQRYDGSAWSANGIAQLDGSTTLTIAGLAFPCVVNMTWALVGGQFKMTAMNFGGSSTCTGTVVTGLSATVSGPAPIASSSAVRFTADPVTFNLPPPFPPCTIRIAGAMTNANPNSGPANNAVTLTSAVVSGPCSSFRSNPSLITSGPIQAVP